METGRYIYRYWGTIDMTKALVHQTPDAIKHAYTHYFGVTPYKVKLVGKKLTRYHTHRHFIAYFGLDTHHLLRKKLDKTGSPIGASGLHSENGKLRFKFWYGDNYTVTTDYDPLKAISTDLGQGMSTDVEAPTTESLTPRRAKRRARRARISLPPSAGTPAVSPLEVR